MKKQKTDKKTITGIFIDASKKRIEEIEVRPGELGDIYAHLKCDCFDVARPDGLTGRDGVFVDDEGLFKENITECFLFNRQFLAGNGLILGCNDAGESISAETPLLTVALAVDFPPAGWVMPQADREKILAGGFIATLTAEGGAQ